MNTEAILKINKTNESDLIEEELDNIPDGYFTKLEVIGVLENSLNRDILPIICKKIRFRGKLIISGLDGIAFCRSVANGEISLHDASKVFCQHTNNLYSLIILKEFFETNHWKIIFSGLEGLRYLIEVEKNG